eukprot:TRINITY_DN13654_c0_g3_i1.p1 TRINITY_DN13654_c0_g3~~TRINITY_DN13654_c0_g3_i1.p1  ORF type:complete len:1129 (+),score=290.31 TRINITY_DN13654_c0_g3_i1:41-3427(+)
MGTVEEPDYAVTELENLNGARARRHFLYIYVAIALGTMLSFYDYTTMWECHNLCQEQNACTGNSAACLGNVTALAAGDAGDVVFRAHWASDLHHLHWLNRFTHMTLVVAPDDAAAGGDPDGDGGVDEGYGMMRVSQTVWTQLSPLPKARSDVIDLSHCDRAQLCSSSPIRLIPGSLKRLAVALSYGSDASLDWWGTHADELAPLNSSEPGVPPLFAPHQVSFVLEFQSGTYTAMDLIARAALILVIGAVSWWFRRRLMATTAPPTPEQSWAMTILIVLVVYVNPLSIISALAVFENRVGLVMEFVEFHAATYFTILIQYMYISIVTGMSGGLRPAWRWFWIVWAWLMVLADLLVAVFVKGPSLDYTSTFVGWVLRTEVQHLSPVLAAFYVTGLVLFAVWLIGAVVTTRQLRSWLRSAPYGPTRRKQLTFRSFLFTVWAYALSRTVCVVLYWLVVGDTRQAYRSADELGAVTMCAVLTFSLVYQFSPSAPRSLSAPPPPSEPSWENPRWRTLVWSSKWYSWLRVHGGTLYHFLTEAEAAHFERLQALPSESLILVWCSAVEGWPVRDAPAFAARVVGRVLPTKKTKCVMLVLDSGRWYQLPDGTYFSKDEEDVAGEWREIEDYDAGEDSASASALSRGSFFEPEGNVSMLLEGEAKERLFFCVETAGRMADLCYASYYQPGEADFRLAVPRNEALFGWNLIVQNCCIGIVALAGAIGAVATGLERSVSPVAAGAPAAFGSGSLRNFSAFLPNRLSSSRSNSPHSPHAESPAMDPRAPPPLSLSRSPNVPLDTQEGPAVTSRPSTPLSSCAALSVDEAPTADLASLGMRLFDVVELSGTRVFITVPADGTHAVYVAFRGSDLRFSNANLVSDLRFGRRVWRTMTDGAGHRFGGCCGQPILHRGFMDMWEKARGGHNLNGPLQSIPLRDVVLGTVEKAMQAFGCPYTDIRVYSTGHSLGASLACIFAYSVKRRRGVDCTVYTFGQPKLGNGAFRRLYESYVPNTFRVVYEYDPVVHVSGTLCNYHVGREVCVDRRGTLLVEPTWVEKTFQPTKQLAMGDMGGHGLGSYCTALNRVFLRAGCCIRCHYPAAAAQQEAHEEEGAVPMTPGNVDHYEQDTELLALGSPFDEDLI